MTRLRALSPLLLALCVFVSLQLLTHSALETDLALVGVGILLSSLAVGAWEPWCVAAVAGGSVLHLLVSPLSPELGGAVFFASVFLPRALGGRTRLQGLSVVLLSATMGALAVLLVAGYRLSYSATPWLHFGAANLMAIVLVGSALLPKVDEGVARSLRRLAHRAKGPTRRSLLRAIALRRRHALVLEGFSKRAQERIARAWDELTVVARRQLDNPSRGRSIHSKRIEAYVSALQSATRAARASTQASMAIEDDVLVQLWSEQEQLQASAEAWRDVQELGAPRV